MANLDQPLRKVAQTVMATFGTSVTIRRVAGTYSTATGTVTETNTDKTVKGRLSNYRDRDFSQLIHVGDRKLEVAAIDVGFLPTIDDVVLIGGVEHEIVNVTQDLATDLPALYTLQVRR